MENMLRRYSNRKEMSFGHLRLLCMIIIDLVHSFMLLHRYAKAYELESVAANAGSRTNTVAPARTPA